MVVVIPAFVELVAAPVPHFTIPTEVADKQLALRVAVDGAPEEHIFALPLLRNEMGVLEQVIENIGVEDRLVLEQLAKFIALDGASLLLIAEIKFDSVRVPDELSTLDVFLDLPKAGDVGVAVAVDGAGLDDDLGVTSEETLDAFHSAELIENSFDLTKSKIRILHCGSHF